MRKSTNRHKDGSHIWAHCSRITNLTNPTLLRCGDYSIRMARIVAFLVRFAHHRCAVRPTSKMVYNAHTDTEYAHTLNSEARCLQKKSPLAASTPRLPPSGRKAVNDCGQPWRHRPVPGRTRTIPIWRLHRISNGTFGDYKNPGCCTHGKRPSRNRKSPIAAKSRR